MKHLSVPGASLRKQSPPSRSLRFSIVLITALFTSACVYPYVNYTRKQIMIAGKGVDDPPIMDVDSAGQLIKGLASELKKARNERNVARTVLAEVIFYGSLVAVYGIAAQETGARNAGAGLAGISASLDSHYGLAAQKLAIGNAYSRASCLQDAINGINADTLVLFDENNLGSDKANEALHAIPDQALAAVQEISNQLVNDLSAVNMTATSLAEVQDIAEKFSKDANEAEKARAKKNSKHMTLALASAKGPAAARTAKIEAAIELQKKTTFLQRVLRFSSASQACVKLALKAG